MHPDAVQKRRRLRGAGIDLVVAAASSACVAFEHGQGVWLAVCDGPARNEPSLAKVNFCRREQRLRQLAKAFVELAFNPIGFLWKPVVRRRDHAANAQGGIAFAYINLRFMLVGDIFQRGRIPGDAFGHVVVQRVEVAQQTYRHRKDRVDFPGELSHPFGRQWQVTVGSHLSFGRRRASIASGLHTGAADSAVEQDQRLLAADGVGERAQVVLDRGDPRFFLVVVHVLPFVDVVFRRMRA